MLGQLGRSDGHDVIRLGQVDVHRHAVFLAGVAHDVGEVVGGRRRAAPGLGGAIHQLQAVGNQAGAIHAVARFLDQFGDVYAHRTGEGAAAAQAARVEQQRLPFLQHVDPDAGAYAEQAVQRRERPDMVVIGLFERLQLVDRRIFRIAGRDVVLAGRGAHAATDAGVHVDRRGFRKVADKSLHGRVAAGEVGPVALHVIGDAGGCGLGGHSCAPLWLKRMPVAPRENTNRKACMSLPKGNQIRKTQMLRICSASSVS